MKKLSIGMMLLLGVSACAEREQSNNEMEPAVVTTAEGAPTADPTADATPCPIMRDYDWSAKIAAGKGGARELTVRGMIEVNKAGYAAALSAGKLDKSMPPIQHLTLTVTPPNDQGADVVTSLSVKISLPAEPGYRAIVIDCGDKEIERIEKIEGD